MAVHRRAREEDSLPAEVPKGSGGRCRLCANGCEIAEGERGFCGVQRRAGGRVMPVTGDWRRALLYWYHDPLPTNCCATWVCPGGSSSGYPSFSLSRGPEYGYKNLAVFYGACNFDCLFCQNWSYRRGGLREVEVKELLEAVDERTTCVCYFGGDPTPQVVHALLTSKMILKERKGRPLRICWETNGGASPILMRQMAQVSLQSGGCIKVDLKCWSEEMSYALSGVSNRQTLENFRLLASLRPRRPDPPLLVASTLLVPGYVDPYEVRGIARFIASLDPSIPYTLLAFHPDFLMDDLPPTPRSYALECLQVAREEGLKEVHLGNLHLLW